MAVFFRNICKFGGCGIVFPTLRDLILHIEETHIGDFDPDLLDLKDHQKPSSLPISCILRIVSNPFRDTEFPKGKARSHSPASSVVSNATTTTTTTTESEFDEILSSSEDSSDSWISPESSPDYIFKMVDSIIDNDTKVFVCPISGCKKQYKNLNSLRSHTKTGHKQRKPPIFICHCGRKYKTAVGIKNHKMTCNTLVVKPGRRAATKDNLIPSQPYEPLGKRNLGEIAVLSNGFPSDNSSENSIANTVSSSNGHLSSASFAINNKFEISQYQSDVPQDQQLLAPSSNIAHELFNHEAVTPDSQIHSVSLKLLKDLLSSEIPKSNLSFPAANCSTVTYPTSFI